MGDDEILDSKLKRQNGLDKRTTIVTLALGPFCFIFFLILKCTLNTVKNFVYL